MLILLYKVIDSLYNTGFTPLTVMLTMLTSPLFIRKFLFKANKATEQVSGSTLPLRAICVYIYIPDYKKSQEL